jgi:hypothetical protein
VALINTEAAAARLARAIVADLTKYNADALAAGTDTSPLVEEGRVLFESRVPRKLRMIYENAIAASAFAPHALDQPALDARPEIEVPPLAAPKRSTLIMYAVVTSLVCVAIWVLFLRGASSAP